MGDRWTLLVIRDLFRGKSRFAEFSRAPEGIATNVLADRLARLVRAGLVERDDSRSAARPVYRLTEPGRALGPVLRELRDWGLTHVDDTRAAPGLEPGGHHERHGPARREDQPPHG